MNRQLIKPWFCHEALWLSDYYDITTSTLHYKGLPVEKPNLSLTKYNAVRFSDMDQSQWSRLKCEISQSVQSFASASQFFSIPPSFPLGASLHKIKGYFQTAETEPANFGITVFIFKQNLVYVGYLIVRFL